MMRLIQRYTNFACWLTIAIHQTEQTICAVQQQQPISSSVDNEYKFIATITYKNCWTIVFVKPAPLSMVSLRILPYSTGTHWQHCITKDSLREE